MVVVDRGGVSPSRLEAARNRLAHRGPDGNTLWIDDSRTVGLVHTRLAIVDLEGGQQPIANEDGTVQVVFNGEIYNHIELRAQLEQKGHRFRTRCDTEVLVHLYEEHGTALCEHLNGMFAFAIWDITAESLLLGRDRLGKKPLFIHASSDRVVFASELKALHTLIDRQPPVDLQAISDYLTLKYVPHERELFQGITQLSPGHTMTWCGGRTQLASYWSYPSLQQTFPGSFEEAGQCLRDLLRDATQLRLRSDVPVGVLLSGGIDSAIVVGLLAEAGVRPIRTFTASFLDQGPDERPFARAVARRFGTEHQELMVKPPGPELVYQVLDQFDEPFADTSSIPTYLICEQASRHVKVVLTGDGGDESFLGYTRYVQLRQYARQRHWFGPMLQYSGLSTLGRMLCQHPTQRTWRRRFRTLTSRWSPDPAEVYERWYSAFSRDLKQQLCRETMHKALLDRADTETQLAHDLRSLSISDPVAAAAAYDLQHYLPDAVLTKVDRASMAHALECRSPLLDYRVVELAAQMPTSWRLHPQYGSKWLLRAACRDLLPTEIWNRPKEGFGAPVGNWLRGELLEHLLADCIPSHGLERWLDARVAQRLIHDHCAHIEDHTFRLWTLLSLNRFWKRFGA